MSIEEETGSMAVDWAKPVQFNSITPLILDQSPWLRTVRSLLLVHQSSSTIAASLKTWPRGARSMKATDSLCVFDAADLLCSCLVSHRHGKDALVL
jgi:hypothetical protein